MRRKRRQARRVFRRGKEDVNFTAPQATQDLESKGVKKRNFTAIMQDVAARNRWLKHGI